MIMIYIMDIHFGTIERVLMGEAATISEWGNSRAVRIPVRILREAQLDLHDRVLFSVEDGVVSFRKDKSVAKTWRSFAGAVPRAEASLIEAALKDTEQVDLDEW